LKNFKIIPGSTYTFWQNKLQQWKRRKRRRRKKNKKEKKKEEE